MRDPIVEFPDTSVSYVAGNAAQPIHEQAPLAFRALEATLTTLRGRRFYAALIGPEYRACRRAIALERPNFADAWPPDGSRRASAAGNGDRSAPERREGRHG